MFHVTEINRLEELSTFRLTWDELWHRGRCKRFQMTYAWLEAYWQQEPDRNLKVLIVSLAGKVIGLLPLVVKQSETRLGTQRVLTYPLDDWGNWYGPIGPNSAATLTACLRYLANGARDWDLLDLTYTDRDRFDLGRTLTAARNIGWPATERVWQQIPQIELSGSWADFLNRKRPEFLTEILLAEQAVAQSGPLQLLQYRSEDSPTYQSAPSLSARLADWKTLLGAVGQAREFRSIEQFALAADKQGQLEISVLTSNSQPVAASLGFVYAGQGEIVRSVCVPELLQGNTEVLPHQLESVLLGRILEAGLLRGDLCYEVTAHCALAATAQTLWSTEILQSFRYSMAPWNHVRSSLLVRYHAAWGKPIPRRTGAKNSVPPVPVQQLPATNAPTTETAPAPQLSIFR